MRKLFSPQSVAVVGASPSHQWGRQSLENFGSVGYKGKVAAVNPKYDDILGYPCAPSLKELPFVPDAVLVGVNRDRVVAVIEEAAEVGAKGAVVFAIGFGELGEEGRARQQRLTDVAREAGMAVVGPNCQGIINFHAATPLYMGHVDPYEGGSVALISQSGSVTTALTNNNRGVRWSHVVSAGNEAVVDTADLVALFVDDPKVRVICAFLETVRDPARFFAECDRASAAGKPIVVVKSGRTEAARVAATAHSGALSAPDRLIDALFLRHGVLRVDTLEELLETAIALQGTRRPARGNLVSVTASGGQIELILDESARVGLQHMAFTEPTKSELVTLLPDFLATTNPLDYWGMDDLPTRYPALMRAVTNDDNVDIVVAVGDFTSYPTGKENRASTQLETALSYRSETDKVLVVLDTVDGAIPAADVERALAEDVILLSGLTEGMRAIERLVTFSQPTPPPRPEHAFDVEACRRVIASFATSTSGVPALDLLTAAGLAIPGMATADTVDAAVTAADGLGYPVALKSADPQLLHKTESGGVLLNLRTADDVRSATQALLQGTEEGVLIQQQVTSGVELLLGLQRDPELGLFILVGLGGIWTEIFDDVVIRATGLRQGEAAEMLGRLRGFPLLTGARGAKPVDMAALVEAIERLDAVAEALGDSIEAVDINPLIAGEDGVVAVDCLVVPRVTGA